MSVDVKEFMREKFVDAASAYVNDLKAMSHEQLDTSPGGSARCGYDFTYEVAYINRRLGARISGATPTPPPQGWIKAEDSYKNKDAAIADVESSAQELLDVWDALPADDLKRVIELPNGDTTHPLDMMWIGVFHFGYHDAQLNYLQAIFGDEEVHWE